jgi:hypothetical protein
MKFEFSIQRTPQRNGRVERKFQIFYGGIRTILNNGVFEDSLRSGVFSDCARTTTFLSNISPIMANDELIIGNKPKILISLRIYR